MLAAGFALLALPSADLAQQPAVNLVAAAELPEAPQPQFALAQPGVEQAAASQESSSSSQPAAQQPEKGQREKADEQLKEQEKQRVVGIVPSFNVSYRADAISLTASQKLHLAFRSAVDPMAFASAFVMAGYHEGMNNIDFQWGAKGYGQRAGVAYLDSFDGTMIGNGILPAILHQDPRYFRLGHGATTHRMLYALMSGVVCKHDNTHKWEPNYSNVLGNLASGGISNLYYPSANSNGVGQTFTTGLVETAEGGFGSLFQEFWPDISRKFLHKDPTRGLDAQTRAADLAAKQAKKDQK